MKIAIRHFTDDPLEIEIDEKTAWCAKTMEEALAGVHQGGAVVPKGHLHLQKTLTQVDLSGEISFTITAQCDRCLDSFPLEMDLPLRVTFVPQTLVHDSQDIDAEDGNVFTYSNDQIDLAAVLYELAVLAIPLRFCCSPSCEGLCPQCGSNRNRETCACKPEALDPRFSVLSQLNPHVH